MGRLASRPFSRELAHIMIYVREWVFPEDGPLSPTLTKSGSSCWWNFLTCSVPSSLKLMHGPAMNIEVQADAKPSCVHSSRPIPYAFRDQIKDQLDEMVANHIIEQVSEPSSWCHPIVIVDKKGTSEKRITVDFKKLNDQVKSPAHPVKTARDVVPGIGSAKYFSKLDARHGYLQVPLTESAKETTTFITPYGRYRYLRNPQGLISAGDEFNWRTDAAFAELPNFVKIVDDCLVHDTDLETHLSHICAVLTRAREHGITLSAKKFVFGAESVYFCGYQVSEDCWVVDDAKVSAIADFPVPANRTDLRSFMGLVSQVSEFTPKLAELTEPRPCEAYSRLPTSLLGLQSTLLRSTPPRVS